MFDQQWSFEASLLGVLQTAFLGQKATSKPLLLHNNSLLKASAPEKADFLDVKITSSGRWAVDFLLQI